MSFNRQLCRFGFLLLAAVFPVQSVFAQCSTVNLLSPGGVPLTTFQTFPQNNTVCRFGGDIAGVRGLVSCISATTPVTAQNVNQLQSILSKATSSQTLLTAEIARIDNDVDFVVLGRQTLTTPNVFEFAILNRTQFSQYVQNGYPPYASSINVIRFSVGGVTRRSILTPRNRSLPGTVDATMIVDTSGEAIAISGFDRLNINSRFIIHRFTNSAPGHAFDPFTVCTGPIATLFTDAFHQFGLSVGGLTTPANIRFVAHD